jgi:hypothetical protein
VRAARAGDGIVPWRTADIPGYEDGLVDGIRDHAKQGDQIVIVGGGWGVSSVIAARQVGESGQVLTYEGGADAVHKITDTVSLNSVSETVSVQHAVVSDAISLRGSGKQAQRIRPTELPSCDGLVLDCEGAELDILAEMERRPRFIIVETHGMFDSPKEAVFERLEQLGYNIISQTIAETRVPEICETKGIYVLQAVHNSNDHDSGEMTAEAGSDQ